MMMGPYDRGGVHHRGPQVAGTSHQLPLRKAPPSTSASSANLTPYFHHLLDRSSSASSSTNSLLFTPTSSFVDAPVPMNSAGKRPRPSTTNNNFLTPSFGFPSPPPFETEHPLPDFNNWGFAGKNVTRSISANTNTLTATSHGNSASNAATTSSLSSIGSGLSSPNGASMFAGVDSFLPDYDSTLYSLWNAPGGAGVMDYDTENDAAQDQHQQVQPPLYITSDDELKMDYPQLTEFNQDLDSYLNDTMESGGPSPTTPLGTSTAHSMIKMDHLVTTDRRTGAAGLGSSISLTGVREPQLLAPAAAIGAAEYLKRDREVTGSETTSKHSVKRSRGDFSDAYGIAPITSDNATGSIPSSSSTSTFRNLPKRTVIEPKRAMPSLGSFHSGPSPLMLTSAASQASSRTSTTATVVTSTTTSDSAVTKAGKRPRSRQCEFPGCQNRARSHQKCKKHGGAHQCVFEGCTKNSQSRGLCIAHGGGSRCKREGCVRAAQSKGLCKSHGGGEFCAVEGCNKKAHLKHLCRTHGGGVRCKVDKCLKWAQRKGWCMAHAKEFSAA